MVGLGVPGGTVTFGICIHVSSSERVSIIALIYFGSTPHTGWQWNVKVYGDSLPTKNAIRSIKPTWHSKITIFNGRYISKWLFFSIFMLVFGGVILVVIDSYRYILSPHPNNQRRWSFLGFVFVGDFFTDWNPMGWKSPCFHHHLGEEVWFTLSKHRMAKQIQVSRGSRKAMWSADTESSAFRIYESLGVVESWVVFGGSSQLVSG